jgi:uncharacterized protein (DUF427 family)
MTERSIKIPGPDHPITIEADPDRVVVTLGGQTIADTTAALLLREAAYPAVQYIPRHNVDMAALERSDHTTYCPYKGEASYFDIVVGEGATGADSDAGAVWYYPEPYDAVEAIRDHVAFYADRVAITSES